MDMYRCSSSRSSSSSGSFSSSWTADRMVRIEMEAAEALANLAHLAMRETGSGDSGGKWGTKGKRGKKRVKSESPHPDYSVSDAVFNSVLTYPDLARDRAVADQQHGGSTCRNVVTTPAKTELDTDVPKPSPGCVKSHPSYGSSRSRHNLTETEKEARRLRRILANRESARQTIRRRQALCEELTKKAADLAWENETLKREKELALKKYQSLESINEQLKAQMSKLIKPKVEESPGDCKSSHVENHTIAAANCPLLLYNQHRFSPLYWSSISQFLNPVQSHHGLENAIVIQCSNPMHSNNGPPNSIVIPSNISMQPNGELDSSEQQQEIMIVSGSRTPLYIVSCPWFFPVPDGGNAVHPQLSSGLKHMQDGTSLSNRCCSSSSLKPAAPMENQLSFLPKKVKSEAASSSEVGVINDLNEMPVGFSPDEGSQFAAYPNETVLTPTLCSTITTVAVKNENGHQSEFVTHTDGICAKPRQLIRALSGKNQDPFKFPSKKLLDAAVAAKARRRRKELTKLKNFHSRQCRTNC